MMNNEQGRTYKFAPTIGRKPMDLADSVGADLCLPRKRHSCLLPYLFYLFL